MENLPYTPEDKLSFLELCHIVPEKVDTVPGKHFQVDAIKMVSEAGYFPAILLRYKSGELHLKLHKEDDTYRLVGEDHRTYGSTETYEVSGISLGVVLNEILTAVFPPMLLS